MEVCKRICDGGGCGGCCGDHPDSGGNINYLLWGEYKVYRVKMCGQIELDIQ